ncbi:MAG: hypothetical protein AAGC97_04775, partial [Planctomycetota bacterium]
TVLEVIDAPNLFGFAPPSWHETLETLFDWFLVYPAASFAIAFTLCGLRLLRRLWLGGDSAVYLHSPKAFFACWAWFMLLGAVGMPTLAAWSFCYWLGPWWT